MRSIWWMGMTAAAVALLASGCGDPPSLVGEPCQTDDHCGTEAGLALTCEHAVPGGYCTLIGCDPEVTTSCPKGSICVAQGDSTACLRSCETVLDCREVIACRPDPDCDPGLEQCDQQCDNRMQCVPPAEAGDDEDALGTCQFSAG